MNGRFQSIVRPEGWFLWSLVLGWTATVAAGFGALMVYENSPGPAGIAGYAPVLAGAGAPDWRLVLGVHPRCPCTRATVANLQELLDPDLRDRVAVQALVYTPTTAPDDWRDTDINRSLRSIDGVTITPDPGGLLSEGHGILTSGGVVLYDASGTARFHGGITPSRGHRGECVGSEAVRAIVAGREPIAAATPVFGCAIHSEEPIRP